jgi:hypothetical protein
MPNNNINQDHIYETSLLGWAVQEYINGDTDWNTHAVFRDEQDARHFCERLSSLDPQGNYELTWVGTLHSS